MKRLPKTFRIAGKKHHLIGMVDDGVVSIVVSKYWRASKGCWHYVAEDFHTVLAGIKFERERAENDRNQVLKGAFNPCN